MTKSEKIRFIAFYLPQYHPISENDEWWGEGFTEWTNVIKAKPLFSGHHQPNLPADLGFYDLRSPAAREAQSDLAKKYGIEGFAYWHYWFAGRRVLEQPFKEVLSSGKPDLPFCLAWANESWSGVWYGSPKKILIEQTYPGPSDHKAHFESLLGAFRDPRYLKVNGRPLFFVFRPLQLPDPMGFTQYWRKLASEAGLKGLYLVGLHFQGCTLPNDLGFDAYTVHNPDHIWNNYEPQMYRDPPWRYVGKKITSRFSQNLAEKLFPERKPAVYSYELALRDGFLKKDPAHPFHPTVFPNWDNTPRSGINGKIFMGSTPELFKKQLKKAVQAATAGAGGEKLIFIKSWNEWAEGNYLEPDQRWGLSYLEALRDELSRGS